MILEVSVGNELMKARFKCDQAKQNKVSTFDKANKM